MNKNNNFHVAPTTVAPVVTTVEASQTTELVTEREPTEAEKVSTEESGGTSGIVQPITKVQVLRNKEIVWFITKWDFI